MNTLKLYWKGYWGKCHSDGYFADGYSQERILKQFMEDAGLDHRNFLFVTIEQMEKVRAVARGYGYEIHLIGVGNKG